MNFKEIRIKIKRYNNILLSLRYLVGFLFLIMCAFIPKIINELFKIPNKYWLFETSFNSKEVLSFWGSFLAFLGTIALVILALWQNNRLAKTNDRLLKLEKNRDRPFIRILSIDSKVSLEDSINKSLSLNCSFRNIGKGLSTDTCFFAPKIENGITGQLTDSNDEYDNILINTNDEMKLNFTFSNLEISTSDYWILHLNIHTEDINSIENKQDIRIRLEVINTDIEISNVTYMVFEYCDYDEKDPSDD